MASGYQVLGEEKRRTGDWCAWEVRVGRQWGHGTLGSGTVMDRLDCKHSETKSQVNILDRLV